jgi:hypothetical protein
MLSAVITARNAGVSFETIRALLNRAGMPITVETLKKYYFDLRKELDIVIAAKIHAKKLASAQTAIQKKLILRDLQKTENALDTRLESMPSEAEKEKFSLAGVEGARGTTTANTYEPAPSTAVREIGFPSKKKAPAIINSVTVAETFTSIFTITELSGDAQTLEQIETLSLEREKDDTYEHPDLPEDVILQDGRVYLVSGKPYVGTLKKKQIYVLRQNGKLIAPTPSRTAKDFVRMPRVL